MLLRRIGECSTHAVRRAVVQRSATALPQHAAPQPADFSLFAQSGSRSSSSAAAPTPNNELRGLNSRDVFDAAPSATFLKARLIKALTEINSGLSASGDKINAESAMALLYAADALRQYPDILQSHLNTISTALSGFYMKNAIPDSDVEVLQNVLAHACLTPRNVASQRERQSTFSLYTIANRYAEWLVAEARRAESAESARLRHILTRFEQQVGELSASGSDRLMVPYVAAWAVLNARTGRTRPDGVHITFPHDTTITGWISKNAWGDAAGGADVNAAAKALCDAHDDATMPTTVDGLAARLFSLRNRGKVGTVVELWDAYAAEFDKSSSSHPLAARDVRMEALAKFLSVVRSRSSQSASRTVHEREALAHVEAEVRKRVPKPTPLPVLHTLLSTAGPEDLEEGAGLPRDKTAVLSAAKEIWEAARAEGVVRDERAYGIYLGLLGRYHEGQELFRVWDELVADSKCRELEGKRADEERRAAKGKGKEKAKEKGATAWPSTLILNQVLSSAFIIGSRTADMALALYGIAVDPKSPLVADLFTLNIALRFASYCSDLNLMNEVISAAGPLGLVPDIVTYTTLVQGLLRAGRPELARQTLDSMKARGMEPNERMAAMLVADLSAGGKADGLTRAEDVIRDMRKRGIRTTVPMWTSLVAGYFRGGWEVDAWAALERMRASGLRLNDVGYNVVLRHVLSADAGISSTPGSGGPGASPRAQRALGRKMSSDGSTASLAMKVFAHMKDNNVPPTNDTYAILLGGLLRSDSVGDIREVLKDMDNRGFKTSNRSLSETIRTARKSLNRSARMRSERV